MNIVDKCLSAIVTMSQKCLRGEQFQATVRKFLECLANSNNFSNKDRTLLTQEGLLIAITSILWRTSRTNDTVNEQYGDGALPEGVYRIDFDKELASHLYTTVDDMFKMYNKVIPDGLYMLSALSSILKEAFIPKLNELHKYTDHSIRMVGEVELLRAGFDTLGHLCRNFPQDFGVFLPASMEYILNCLKDQSIPKENKPIIFTTLGDIALGAPALIIQNIAQIFNLYEMAYDAIIALSDTKQPENIEYAECLKENIIDSMVCIVHGALYADIVVNNQEAQHITHQHVKNHFPKLQTFIENATKRQYNPTIDFVSNCLGLLADIYGPDLARSGGVFVKQDLINNLIGVLKPHAQSSPQVNQIIDWTQRTLVSGFHNSM